MESEIGKIHERLKKGSISCSGLVSQKIKELEESPNNTANYLLAESAMEHAAKVDKKLSAGEKIGLLEGIPFGIKDVYMLQGCRASASSAFLKNYIAPYTATAIQKLMDAGAIPVVKEAVSIQQNYVAFSHQVDFVHSIFFFITQTAWGVFQIYILLHWHGSDRGIVNHAV